jgi:anti-sigma factor RsiW
VSPDDGGVDDVVCRELVERITDLFEGRLPADEQAAINAHLEGCPGCVAAVEQFRRTVELLGRLPDDDVRDLDPAVVESLTAAFRRHRR